MHPMLKKIALVLLCLVAILSSTIALHSAAMTHLLAALHRRPLHPLEHLFWDAEPYAAGIADYNAGRSPYSTEDLTNPLPFAYPPAFAWVGGALARALPSPWGWSLYVALYMICVFAVETVMAVFFLGKVGRAQRVGMLCFLPLGLAMSTMFWSGNIHMVWNGLALAAAIPGLRKGRWLAFYVVALMAMINQPVFLLLLMLPVFVGEGQRMWSIATAVGGGFGYFAQRVVAPSMYAQFQAAVTSHLAASRDFGEGIFGILTTYLGRVDVLDTTVPGAIQILFSLGVLVTLFRLRPRVDRHDLRWWALIAIAIVIVNPRVMPYDAGLALAPAIYFFLYGLKTGRQWRTIVPVVVLSLIAHNPLGFTLLLVVAFVVGVRWLGHVPLLDHTNAAATD